MGLVGSPATQAADFHGTRHQTMASERVASPRGKDRRLPAGQFDTRLDGVRPGAVANSTAPFAGAIAGGVVPFTRCMG